MTQERLSASALIEHILREGAKNLSRYRWRPHKVFNEPAEPLEAYYARLRALYDVSEYRDDKDIDVIAIDHAVSALEELGKSPSMDVAVVLSEMVEDLMRENNQVFRFPNFKPSLDTASRDQLRRRLQEIEPYLIHEERIWTIFKIGVRSTVGHLADALPKFDTKEGGVTVPLFSLVKTRELVEDIGAVFFQAKIFEEDFAGSLAFAKTRSQLYANLLAASKLTEEQARKSPSRIITPENSKLPARELVQAYLAGTPFAQFFLMEVPMSIPEETRFAGTWIVAPPGRGKTTLLKHLVSEDIKKKASVVIMDSKGELTDVVKHLKPIKDRLVLVEPEMRIALNPFDIGKGAQVVSLLEYIFASLLDARLTPLQATLFRCTIAATLYHDHPTFETFRGIIKDGVQDVNILPDDLKEFFAEEFPTPTYTKTREGLKWRLRLMRQNEVLWDMFCAPETKFNLSKEMDAGKVIVINNSKALIGEENSEFFGRFFIALILAAAQQRTLKKEEDKLPCYVYIDECQSVIRRDEKIATILDECRSQKIALILAHQRCNQLENDVLSAVANCGVRYCNADDDAPILAPKLRTDVDSIRSLSRGSFAVYARDLGAFTVRVPLTDMPRMSDEEYRDVMASMKKFTYEHSATLQNTESPNVDDVSTEASKDW